MDAIDQDNARRRCAETGTSTMKQSAANARQSSVVEEVAVARRAAAPRPEHYKVICISFYNDDMKRLDGVVRELKRRGFTKANRSAVLRVALEQLDLDRVPKGL